MELQTVEVSRASMAEKPILANLMELYIYDLSRVVPDKEIFTLDHNGRFGYPRFDRFWQDDDRAAYLFRVNGKLAGFCLIHSSPFFNRDKAAKVIGEFFVMHAYRNKSVGTIAASKVMQLYPGYWEMRVIDANAVAVHFWEKVLRVVAGSDYAIQQKHDTEWVGKVFVGNVPRKDSRLNR